MAPKEFARKGTTIVGIHIDDRSTDFDDLSRYIQLLDQFIIERHSPRHVSHDDGIESAVGRNRGLK